MHAVKFTRAARDAATLLRRQRGTLHVVLELVLARGRVLVSRRNHLLLVQSLANLLALGHNVLGWVHLIKIGKTILTVDFTVRRQETVNLLHVP